MVWGMGAWLALEMARAAPPAADPVERESESGRRERRGELGSSGNPSAIPLQAGGEAPKSVELGYHDLIRRAVSEWWRKNLDELPSTVPLGRLRYRTEVAVVLSPDGTLHSIDVTRASGVSQLDGCVVRAFMMAAPFAAPPDELVGEDGRVHLLSFDFTVQLSGVRSSLPDPDEVEPSR
jgi:outer membrane biosynthesis protein TonB